MKKGVDKNGSYISNGYNANDFDFESAFRKYAKDKENPTKNEKLKGLLDAIKDLHPIQIEDSLRSIDFEKHEISFLELLDYANKQLLSTEGSIHELFHTHPGIGASHKFYRERVELVISVIEKLISEFGRKTNFDKIRFNGNTNHLWKFFNDLLSDGSLDTSKANLMRMITDVFLDKKGENISINTLETYGKGNKKYLTEPKKPHTPTKTKKPI